MRLLPKLAFLVVAGVLALVFSWSVRLGVVALVVVFFAFCFWAIRVDVDSRDAADEAEHRAWIASRPEVRDDAT